MDKPNQQRDNRTQKPPMKLQVRLPPNRKARRKDVKRNRRVDFQGMGYGTSRASKGAHGKCKYLIAKEKWLEQMRRSRSVKPVSNVEVYGGRKMGKRFAADAPNISNVPKSIKQNCLTSMVCIK